jgi:hypothetical protein
MARGFGIFILINLIGFILHGSLRFERESYHLSHRELKIPGGLSGKLACRVVFTLNR